MNFYSDDAFVADATRQLVDSGTRIFQIFQRGSEPEHVKFLLDAFDPPHGSTVLDVGCGIGEVSRLMKLARPDLTFILQNISPSQLALCPDFKKICSGGENIPLPDNSVDAVMACHVMGHMNKENALAEFRRVLKRGGVMFIYDVTGGDMPDLGYTAHDWDCVSPTEMNPSAMEKWMPDFSLRYPNIRPVMFREVCG